MIDTDKYEGHYTYHESSVELWNTDDAVTNDYDMFWVTNSEQLNANIERAIATINLIQDAPLLLAEVKRLREEVDNLNEIIDTERKKVYDIAQKLLEVIE